VKCFFVFGFGWFCVVFVSSVPLSGTTPTKRGTTDKHRVGCGRLRNEWTRESLFAGGLRGGVLVIGRYADSHTAEGEHN
jgi:hypothetical protein